MPGIIGEWVHRSREEIRKGMSLGRCCTSVLDIPLYGQFEPRKIVV
jgi:hypothetical protein